MIPLICAYGFIHIYVFKQICSYHSELFRKMTKHDKRAYVTIALQTALSQLSPHQYRCDHDKFSFQENASMISSEVLGIHSLRS